VRTIRDNIGTMRIEDIGGAMKMLKSVDKL
jgi:hypothetical protein